MAHHKSCFTVSDIVDIVETAVLDRAEIFICPPGEDGGDSVEDSGNKDEGGQYKYLLTISTVIHDFTSWNIARGESGYKWVNFFLLHMILFPKSTLKATIVQSLVQSRQSQRILTPI